MILRDFQTHTSVTELDEYDAFCVSVENEILKIDFEDFYDLIFVDSFQLRSMAFN